MFINLFNLINKAAVGDRTPLEDFTTEGLAGILKNKAIGTDFIKWLGMPAGDYDITTQKKYCLTDDMDCKVDLVLESPQVLCFIEIKVESNEGWRQLERYSKALDNDPKQQKFLFYCTKKQDPKNITSHNFKQFRWHEIAIWLKQYHLRQPLVPEFISYLTKHQMTRDTSITQELTTTMQFFQKTYEAMVFHLENAESEFRKTFPVTDKFTKEDKINHISDEDRIAHFTRPVLKQETPNSELLYSIHFEKAKLQTQIWVSKSHPQALQIEKLGEAYGGLKTWNNSGGIGVYLACDLKDFIGNPNSDQQIKEWFANSFVIFKSFMKATSEVEWKDVFLE